MRRRKLLVAVALILLVACGVGAYYVYTLRTGAQVASVAAPGANDFTFGSDWTMRYDPDNEQVIVGGSITNNTGAKHQVGVLVTIRDNTNQQVLLSFTQLLTLPKDGDPVSFTLLQDCPHELRNAYPLFSVVSAD